MIVYFDITENTIKLYYKITLYPSQNGFLCRHCICNTYHICISL